MSEDDKLFYRSLYDYTMKAIERGEEYEAAFRVTQ